MLLDKGGDPCDLGSLCVSLIFRAAKRWIAENVSALRRVEHRCPIYFKGVGVLDGGRGLQREAREVTAEGFGEAHVHDVVHHPERDLGDAHRKFLDFNSIELVHINLG